MRDFYVINNSILHDNSMGIRDNFEMRGFPAGQCEDSASMVAKRPAAAGIEFITAGFGTIKTANNYTFTLPAGLLPGDVIIITTSACNDSSNRDQFATGCTELYDVFVNESRTLNFGVFYKKLSDPVETSIVCNGYFTSVSYSAILTYAVFRGVDQDIQIDVTPVSTATHTNGQNPPNVSHTPVTNGAVIVSCVASAIDTITVGAVPDQEVAALNGFTLNVAQGANNYSGGRNVIVAAIAHKKWIDSDGVVSSSWSGFNGDNPTWSCAANCVFALRPA